LNLDPTPYKLVVETVDSSGPPIFTEIVLNDPLPASDVGVAFANLAPSSATIQHYLFLRNAATSAYIDTSPEFFKLAGPLTLWARVQGATVQWSTAGAGGPWN
jgi:hypothetical protein